MRLIDGNGDKDEEREGEGKWRRSDSDLLEKEEYRNRPWKQKQIRLPASLCDELPSLKMHFRKGRFSRRYLPG